MVCRLDVCTAGARICVPGGAIMDRTDVLTEAGIRISMDGKGQWIDNVFIERLWRSLKYECVYLNAFDSVRDAAVGIDYWMRYYNTERPHSSLGDRTPEEAYLELAA